MKKIVFLLACVVFVSGVYASSEEIEFSGKKSRGPVVFDHELHMGDFECLDCHHVMESGENVLDESDLEEGDPNILCSSCHNSTSKIAKTEAFHYQCMGCHNDYSLTSEPTGPTLCGGCHILKK
jgi:c(7)-type cytochrome triheme protein